LILRLPGASSGCNGRFNRRARHCRQQKSFGRNPAALCLLFSCTSSRAGRAGAVVQRAAERVGIDATELSGHSLRSGLATTAARNGASERSIMKQTGHRSVAMVRRYIHDAELFNDNAGAKLGL
jgi:integrase